MTMKTSIAGIWGPHPTYAILPLLAVGCVLGWVALGEARAAEGLRKATATRPVADGSAARGSSENALSTDPESLPIEVRYGVPASRTLHVWP
jgi:hypothetical protein